MRDILKFCHY